MHGQNNIKPIVLLPYSFVQNLGLRVITVYVHRTVTATGRSCVREN